MKADYYQQQLQYEYRTRLKECQYSDAVGWGLSSERASAHDDVTSDGAHLLHLWTGVWHIKPEDPHAAV